MCIKLAWEHGEITTQYSPVYFNDLPQATDSCYKFLVTEVFNSWLSNSKQYPTANYEIFISGAYINFWLEDGKFYICYISSVLDSCQEINKLKKKMKDLGTISEIYLYPRF